MKKLSFLVAALCATTMALNATNYVKVTSAPTDWSGEYILVYENSATEAYVWIGKDTANCYTTATITNNKVSGEDFVTITVASITDGYSIMVNGGKNKGKYIGGKSGENKLNFETAATLNTLEYETTGVKITSNTSVMRFNSAKDQMRFRYFKSASYSGKKAVQLYKKEESPVTALVAPEMANIYATQGTIEGLGNTGRIFTVSGMEVTSQNGSLASGIYIVKLGDQTQKIAVK